MKIKIHIILLSLILLISGLSSCSKDMMSSEDVNMDIDYLAVYGGAYDKDSTNPLDSIMVILSAYSSKERVKVISSDTTFTKDGEYTFVLSSFSSSRAYDITAIDVDGERNGGRYRSSKITLFVSYDSPLYNSASKLYYILDQNFYMSKR